MFLQSTVVLDIGIAVVGIFVVVVFGFFGVVVFGFFMVVVFGFFVVVVFGFFVVGVALAALMLNRGTFSRPSVGFLCNPSACFFSASVLAEN